MSDEKKQHPFDQMMYGEKNRKKEYSPSQEEYDGEGVDEGSFLDNVHSIMNSIDELKPLYKKISPFLNQWNSK